MVDVPKCCDSCIHTQVCSKKDIFKSSIQYFENWAAGVSPQDVIVTVRCAHYGNVPHSVVLRNADS